jgi:hypothetical protein
VSEAALLALAELLAKPAMETAVQALTQTGPALVVIGGEAGGAGVVGTGTDGRRRQTAAAPVVAQATVTATAEQCVAPRRLGRRRR